MAVLSMGCFVDEHLAASIANIRSANTDELSLQYDSFSDPEFARDSEDARAIYVLSLIEKRRVIEPRSLDAHMAMFPKYGPYLRCAAVLATSGASREGLDCHARLSVAAADDTEVAALILETLRLRMAESLAGQEPWRAQAMLVVECWRNLSSRSLRALASFHVARGEASEAVKIIDEIGRPLRVADSGKLDSWRRELTARTTLEPDAATQCGRPADWPCGPGQACDCARSVAEPLSRSVCTGTCRPRKQHRAGGAGR